MPLGSKMRKPTHFMSCREWRNKIGLLHRLAGPAIESTSGAKYWWWNNRLICRDLELLFSQASIFPGYSPREEQI